MAAVNPVAPTLVDPVVPAVATPTVPIASPIAPVVVPTIPAITATVPVVPVQTPAPSITIPAVVPFFTPVVIPAVPVSRDGQGNIQTVTDVIQQTNNFSQSQGSSASAIGGGILAAIIAGSVLGLLLIILVLFLIKTRRNRKKDDFPPFFPSSTAIRSETHISQPDSSLYAYSQPQSHSTAQNQMAMQVENGGLVGVLGGYQHSEDIESTPSYYLTDGNGMAVAYNANNVELYSVPYENNDPSVNQHGNQGFYDGHSGYNGGNSTR